MAQFTIGGNPANTVGDLPTPGEKAPGFLLTRTDFSDVSLSDLAGKMVVLNIFPSIDTSVCAASARRFNQEAVKFQDTIVLCVSKDLPFAHARFCEAEGLKDVVPVTELRNLEFGEKYGVRIAEGPLEGLFARAVIVLDPKGTVVYSHIVDELKTEPNYDEVLEIINISAGSVDACTSSSTAEHARAGDDEPCDDGRAG
jgi:thiol peroxidase